MFCRVNNNGVYYVSIAQSTPASRVGTVAAKLFDCGRKCSPDRIPGAKGVNLLVTKHTDWWSQFAGLQDLVGCLRHVAIGDR